MCAFSDKRVITRFYNKRTIKYKYISHTIFISKTELKSASKRPNKTKHLFTVFDNVTFCNLKKVCNIFEVVIFFIIQKAHTIRKGG